MGDMFGCLVAFLAIGLPLWYSLVQIEQQKPENVRKRRLEEQKRKQEAWQTTPEGKAELEKQRQAAIEYEARAREDAQKRREKIVHDTWVSYFERKAMDNIAAMSGVEFEQFLATLLHKLGYANISFTPATADQGADLICDEPLNGIRTVVQAKRYNKSVGNSAVMQVMGAMSYYKAKSALIITNSAFTKSAMALSESDNRISLFDGKWLEQQVLTLFPSEIPPFDAGEFGFIRLFGGMASSAAHPFRLNLVWWSVSSRCLKCS